MSGLHTMTLADPQFNRFLTVSDRAERDELVAADQAFRNALMKAAVKGKEKIKPGTYVDTSPPVHVKHFERQPRLSGCGSPAAMCMESARAGGAIEAMK